MNQIQELSSTAAPAINVESSSRVVEDFIARFESLYREHRHATYVPQRKDCQRVQELLTLFGFDRLVEMALLLMQSDSHDAWLEQSDRGIGVLHHRASSLNNRLASSRMPPPGGAWARVLDVLAARIATHQFATWWTGTREIELRGDVLIVSCESVDHRDYLARNYTRELAAAIADAGVHVSEVVFQPQPGRVPGVATTRAQQERRMAGGRLVDAGRRSVAATV